MRPRRPKISSAGSDLRDALNKSRADADAHEQQREEQAQSALQQQLSTWFNDVAKDIPVKVQEITAAAKRGGTPDTHLSYSADSLGSTLRDATPGDIEENAGFKALDAICEKLDVECTVSQGTYGYGRKSTAGKAFLHVNVDAGKPYQAPVTVETPRRPGYRGRR